MAKDIVVFLKLTEGQSDKLQELSRHTRRNRCEILRALIASATLEHLPRAWQNLEEAAVLAEVEG
jgi:hypothetical protein